MGLSQNDLPGREVFKPRWKYGEGDGCAKMKVLSICFEGVEEFTVDDENAVKGYSSK